MKLYPHIFTHKSAFKNSVYKNMYNFWLGPMAWIENTSTFANYLFATLWCYSLHSDWDHYLQCYGSLYIFKYIDLPSKTISFCRKTGVSCCKSSYALLGSWEIIIEIENYVFPYKEVLVTVWHSCVCYLCISRKTYHSFYLYIYQFSRPKLFPRLRGGGVLLNQFPRFR